MLLKSILLLLAASSIVTSQPLSSDRFDQDAYLDYDRNFRMLWNFNESHILIELRVSTTGWVGVGISENGAMINADIHVGWVKDGRAYITDRHGLGYNGLPPLDSEQNLKLIGGRECDGVTVLTFIRQLAACQLDEDRPITKNTMRVIFGFSSEDPVDDLSWAQYHGYRNRGSRSLLMLMPPVNGGAPSSDEDERTFDLRSDGEPIPVKRTYYKCFLFEMPKLSSKHHLIKSEPIINETFIRNVHHIVVSACDVTLEVDPSLVGKHMDCSVMNRGNALASALSRCQTSVTGWAVGGEGSVFPNHVGIPIGDGAFRYVKFELHYDNPNLININDNSGIRFTYTPNLRRYDAGTIVVGHNTAGTALVIPPNTDHFEIFGTCGSSCLGEAMNMAGVEAINVINVFPHSHLAGRKIKLRHIRNGTELSPIISDDSYDFDYQQSHTISPEIAIRKGDDLMTVCSYSSLEKRRPIMGGLSTNEEMCLSFLIYYPQIPLKACMSQPFNPLDGTLYKMLNITKTKHINHEKGFIRRNLDDVIVTSPEDKFNQTVADVMSSFNWDAAAVRNFERKMKNGRLLEICYGPQPAKGIASIILPLKIKNEYQSPPSEGCLAPSSGFPPSGEANICVPEN